jgi:hypothetical protein
MGVTESKSEREKERRNKEGKLETTRMWKKGKLRKYERKEGKIERW